MNHWKDNLAAHQNTARELKKQYNARGSSIPSKAQSRPLAGRKTEYGALSSTSYLHALAVAERTLRTRPLTADEDEFYFGNISNPLRRLEENSYNIPMGARGWLT